MPRSVIESDPQLRAAVDAAIAGGATIDEIVDTLHGLGAKLGRSSVGRYTQKYAALAKRQRDLQAMSSAFAEQFGSADDRQGRLLVQLTTNVLTRAALDFDAEDEDEGGLSTKELMELARATQATMQAAKIDIDREAKIREEEAKRVKAAAAVAAEEGARAAGASEETIRSVRTRILGLSA